VVTGSTVLGGRDFGEILFAKKKQGVRIERRFLKMAGSREQKYVQINCVHLYL